MILTRTQRRLRTAVKRFIYSQLYLREALLIFFGRSKPFVRFKVEAEPPSVYFNFAIRPEHESSLAQELGLPFPLAPIRCLEGEEPFHCLTLNVYRVSGLANGIRAEWSFYVRDASGTPRYLIAEARANAGSMDPIQIISRKCAVSHAQDGEWLASDVTSEDGSRFRARIRRRPDAPAVRAAPAWIEANDYIYWLNGVCDRTFYDSGLANARATRLDPADVKVEDLSSWGRFIEPEPRHVIVFEGEIEFAMSPWWNIDELADVTPAG